MRSSILALALAASLPVLADDPHAHHDHGAPDLGNIGKAHIDTSCNAAAQKEIDRGVALIHSFWYAPAEKSFRAAAAADPDCAMAWWGVAMSNLHPIWAPPVAAELKTGLEAAEKAKSLTAKTDREKVFVDAIHTFYAGSDKLDHKTRMAAYEAKMSSLAAAHPKDREAAIFHALALLGTADAKDKSYAQQKKAAAILNRVLPEEPEHPGVAHYLIHSFDYPELAELALPAARVYAKLAPGSPHALHMPSHIFVRLGLWDESIASNLASAEKARNFAKKMAPGAVAFDELHAVDYLVYAYLQQGDIEKAKKLVDMAAQVTRLDIPDQFAAAYAIGAAPARFALERRQWKEAAALPVPTVVSWAKVPYAEGNIHFARGIGAARSGDVAAARAAVTRLGEIRQLLLEQKNAYWAEQLDIQRQAVEAWIARAEKKDEDALKRMRAAADLESTTEKHPVTPGPIVPARELLAEMLLEVGKAKDAAAEVQRVLKDAPKRRNALELAARASAATAN
jgi:tetratricopeptide (TPR) repeat protein